MYKQAAARLANWKGDDINALAKELYQILTSPIELQHEGEMTILGDVTLEGDVRSLRWAVARFDAVIVPYATQPNASYVDCWEATDHTGGLTSTPVRVFMPSIGANTECHFDPPPIEAGSIICYQLDQQGKAIAYTLGAMEPTLRIAKPDTAITYGSLTAAAGPFTATLYAPDDSASPTYSATTRSVNVYSACNNWAKADDYIVIQKEVCSKNNELWLMIGICGDASFPGGYAPPMEVNNSEFSTSEFS